MGKNDEFFEEGAEMEDNRTKAKKFYDEHETAIWVGLGVTIGLLLRSSRKRKRMAKQGSDARVALSYNAGYLEGQKDAYKDIAKGRRHYRGKRNER